MSDKIKNHKIKTSLSKVGRDPDKQNGFINPPVYKGSTVLFPDVKSIKANMGAYTYGRHATPTSRAFCDAMTELEGGYDTVLTESGLGAITLVLTTFAHQDAHFLVSDTVYAPTRLSLENIYKKFGVKITYFDPRIGADIETLIAQNTKLIFCESPGSLTMEVHDLPAICEVAKKNHIPVAIDNTWSTPLFHQPIKLGADISIHSGAKYILGHADGFIGSVTATKEWFSQIYQARRHIGYCASSDEAHMALRGLRTLAVRMEAHMKSGLRLAEWFQNQSFVSSVLYPALPSHADHELWKRDFSGAGGLFSVIFKDDYENSLEDILNSLSLFGLGFSYGGFESLVLPFDPSHIRTATSWSHGPAVRFYAGLEDADDLLADIETAFQPIV